MSLKETGNIQKKEDNDANDNELHSSFEFKTDDIVNRSSASFSTYDSAYNSMVCSPFSPVVLSHSSTTKSSIYKENSQLTQVSISPFLESSENEEVFKVSLEHISGEKTYAETENHTFKGYSSNVIFRPISLENENENLNQDGRSQSNLSMQRVISNNSLMSQRSISTQTKLSMKSIGSYRPNSAPLQEGIEEELSDINRNGLINIRDRIHRNSTSHSLRSPMPDLIQPTVYNNSDLFGSKLSLIADQIDESINPPNTRTQSFIRTRRFSTPSIAEMTPGGSFLDLLVSIYNAFDSTLPRRSTRSRTRNFISDHD